MIIYKMQRNFKPSAAERSKYHPDVHVSVQACAVVDTEWMLTNYVSNWERVPTDKHRFLVYDSAGAHLAQLVKNAIAKTSLAVIPGGLTAILQSLDTDFIFIYRHYYKLFSSEWEDKNLNTKLTAAGRRILGTHLTAMAYKKALDQVNIAESFLKRGYLWPTTDGSHIFLRELQGYRYDPAAPLLWLVRPHPDPQD